MASLIDSRSGFCKSNSTFYSKRNPLPLPANPSLDITTFISSQPHRGTTAFIDAATGHHLTFSALWTAVERVADCLHHDIGLRRGHVVLILSPNSIYFPVVSLAVMSLGAVVTTANTLNTAAEILKQVADSNPTLAFTTADLAPKLAGSGISVVLERVGSTRGVNVVGVVSEMMEKEPRGQRVRDRVNEEDTAMLLYSSGTTGPSKGVISSHKNLTALVARFVSEKSICDQIFLCTVPMFHTYGLLCFCMSTVASGSTVVILRRFDLHGMMEAVEKYRATTLALAPPVVVAMTKEADVIMGKYDLSSLGRVRCGGAPLSKEVTLGFMEKYPTVDIFAGYALTESNGAGAYVDSVEESRRYGSVGLLSSGVEARIVDPDTGRLMGVNQTGELWLKGPSIAKVVDVSHPVTIEGSLEPQNQEVPDADDSQPQAEEHIEEQLHDSAPMDQSEQQVDANTETELSEQQVDANTEFVQEVTGQPAVELPSFSLGLTQEGSTVVKDSDHPTNYVSAPMEHDEEAGAKRKSKRAKIAPVGLQDYKCDPKVTSVQAIIPDLDQRFQLIEEKLQNEAEVLVLGGYAVTPAEFCDIAHRQSILPSGIVDALIGIVNRGSAANPKVAIYDTSLPVAIMEHHNRFVKTAVKDRVKLKFSNIPLVTPIPKVPERIYFPFNMDKQHWVGVCIDTKASTLNVFDCKTSLRSDSLLKKEFTPIANLIPYVLKHVGYTEANAVIKPFTVSRCKGIPQITAHTDAAVMTVLFIEAHAFDGLVGCKAVSTRLLPVASKQLAVKLWDYISA